MQNLLILFLFLFLASCAVYTAPKPIKTDKVRIYPKISNDNSSLEAIESIEDVQEK